MAAVFYDYTSEHGVVMMARSTYLRIFGDTTINSLGIFVDPGNPRRQELLEEVRKRAQSRGLPVFTRGQLHGNILSVFDSTFAVTRSMRILTIIVAFFGIAGALLTLFMERQKEFGIYRALGFSTRQVAGMTLMEGFGMGLVSFLLSIGSGDGPGLGPDPGHQPEEFQLDHLLLPRSVSLPDGCGDCRPGQPGGCVCIPIWKVYRTYPQMQIREE